MQEYFIIIEKMVKNKIYVVHFHKSKKPHFDLRLELNKVLKSWAIPKLPPKKIGLKRLAIQVTDHDLEYSKFHGTIPKGQYGAGKVEIWDKGSYELLEKSKNKLIINIKGKKLKGSYALIQFKGKNWLFFKIQQ